MRDHIFVEIEPHHLQDASLPWADWRRHDRSVEFWIGRLHVVLSR